MNHRQSQNDPAFAAMTLDILGNVLSRAGNPGDVGTYLTEEIRELTGARCVVFIHCLSGSAEQSHRVLSVNPSQRHDWAESPAAHKFYENIHHLPSAQIWRPGESSPAAGFLHQEGFDLSLAVPLHVGGFRVGAMLVFGLPDDKWLDSELNILNTLSTILALVLRNAFLYERQEQTIAQRTHQLQASNQTLRESEARFRQVVLESPFPIMLHADDGEVLLISRSWTEITGYSHADVPTIAQWTTRAYGARRDVVRADIDRLYKLDCRVDEGDYTITTSTGEQRTWEFSSTPLGALPDGRRLVMSMARDITDRKRLEAQLQQAQKMEAIGQLAGGVAHDFRNQLTVIQGYGELLLRQSLVLPDGLPLMRQIMHAAGRAAQTTGQLLSFSRRDMLRPRTVNMPALVDEMVQRLRPLVGEDTIIELSHGESDCAADISAGQFEHALMNLAANARDAMPGGGRLSIRTDAIELDESAAKLLPDASPGSYARVTVSDTGKGMSREIQARLFEPFFTTKEVGQGTGLGLPMVYGFVRQSGGFINVRSEPGRGATFELYFPRIAAAGAADSPRAGQSPLPRGKETILVVEDEPAIRQLLTASLRQAGYTVVQTGEPREAMEMARNAETMVDMLIADVVMPGFSGVEVAKHMRQTRPRTPVLFVSGYGMDDLSRRGLDMRNMEVLVKPFEYSRLLVTVRRMLDDRPNH